jgi:3-keto-disaccharide hydrolase
MKTAILILGILSLSVPLCVPASSTTPEADGFASVFNGLNLDGWKMQGHASWKVEHGEIVGQPDPGQGTDCWLFSEEEWTDFTLEIEFKVPEKCNSGIAIRMPREATGDPDMYGYEVQISDAPGRKPTGSLLHHVDSKINNVHKPNEWNRMVITCEGDHIVVQLNGLLVVDTRETGSKRGRIGMQIAKGEEFADQQVRFRNIRIKDLALKVLPP